MSRDIDVDEEQLARFIDALSQFQEVADEKFKAVEADWEKCKESWQGDSKEQFTKDFERTSTSVRETLEAGDEALDWLERFDEIVKEFERNS